jgi:hypothetical protein
MTWIEKTAFALALACTGKQALATAGTVAAAGVTAAQLGMDPLPWVIGAAGSTVVYAYRSPATRAHALANGVVSVFLGGVGAPYAATLVAHYANPVLANQYVLAGVLSVAWPWAAPVVWRRAVAMFNALVQPAKGGGNA